MTNPLTKAAYQEYLDNFDPTPQYAFDGYSIPPEYEEWLNEQLDQIGLY